MGSFQMSKDSAGMPIQVMIVDQEDHDYGPWPMISLEAEMPFNHSALMRFNPEDSIKFGEMLIRKGNQALGLPFRPEEGEIIP